MFRQRSFTNLIWHFPLGANLTALSDCLSLGFAGVILMADKGNYRSIYSSMPDSEDYSKLSKDSRLLLLTIKICRFNNMANIFFCDEGTIVSLSVMTKIPADEIKNLLNGELTDTHWIAFRMPILWLINGLKFEPTFNINNSKQKKGVENLTFW